MKRENLSNIISNIDGRLVAEAFRYDPDLCSGSPERIVQMNRKRIITFALAAAFILALGITAYAVWSIHFARQQELKADLKIEENNVSSYVEYDVPDEQASGLVLLSTVNDGQEQHIYVNISPVSEEEAAAFPDQARFACNIDGTEYGGFAAPQLSVSESLFGADEIRAEVLQDAYDKETQTLTLQCYLDVNMVEQAIAELGTDTFPLSVHMIMEDGENRSFGPIPFALTEEQLRVFDFGHALFHDAELDKEIEIVSLELTPFSAVWKVHYEGDAAFHTPEADWETYEPWCMLEDKVCMEAKIIFSDGTEFSTGGALTAPYENGTVNQFCGWGSAINIDDVQRIVLGDVILWEAT